LKIANKKKAFLRATFILLLGLILIYFFFFHYFQKKLFELSHPWQNEELVYNLPELKSFSKQYNFFAKHPLIGKVSSKLKDQELAQEILYVIDKKIKDPKKRILATGEVLTKVLAYRDLKKGSVISIPLITKLGGNVLVDYSVDKVFDIWGGMPAFGLIPISFKDKASPILLFRGTDSSFATKRAWVSLVSDLDPNGPGLGAFMKAKEKFKEWIKKANSIYPNKTRILGYSLGGAFTSYTLIFEGDLVTSDPLQPSMAFNSPGVINESYKKWNQIEKKPLYINIVTKSDIISKYGHPIGYTYEMVPKKKLMLIQAHVQLMVGEESFNLIKK
jgi:hypothetical protein